MSEFIKILDEAAGKAVLTLRHCSLNSLILITECLLKRTR